jgi:hypothetical protein
VNFGLFDIANGVLVLSASFAAFAGGSKSRRVRKHGFIVGIMGQPAWFYTSFVTGNFGVFILSFMYLAFQVRGVLNNREDRNEEFNKSN